MSRRILVTGATGEPGRYATDLLISQGFEIRALVHKVDERSEKLRARGAEVIVGGPLVAQSGHSKHRLRPVRDVRQDRNDLKVLTGCADFIPNSPSEALPLGIRRKKNRP